MNIFKSIINSFKTVKTTQNLEQIKSEFIAKQIQIYQLPNELKLFLENNTDFDFIGIYSNGDDCIYFAKNGDNLNIEYEAVIESQIPYYEKMKQFASKNNFKIEEKINKDAPYITIITNTSLEETYRLAMEIQRNIFGNNDATKYVLVP